MTRREQAGWVTQRMFTQCRVLIARVTGGVRGPHPGVGRQLQWQWREERQEGVLTGENPSTEGVWKQEGQPKLAWI